MAALANNTAALNALVNVLGPLGVAVAAMAPPAAPAAPVVDLFLQRLKTEFRSDLQEHMATTADWRDPIRVLLPLNWMAVAHLRANPITRLDVEKDDCLPGDFTLGFLLALDTHCPNLPTGTRSQLASKFKSIMNMMASQVPLVQAAMAMVPPNVVQLGVLADQLIKDTRHLIKEAQAIMIEIDTQEVLQTHGPKAAAIFNAMTHKSFAGQRLADPLTQKQVIYLSEISKDGSKVTPAVAPIADANSTQCQRCGVMVPFQGFRAHNPVCPGRKDTGKGVNKQRPLQNLRQPRGRRPPPKKTS